jgi:hypothetical protein
MQLVFHVLFLRKQPVEVGFLFIVLVFDVHKEVLDILGFGVAAVLIQGQVVVCQLTLVLAHVFDKHFVPSFQSEVLGVITVDVINFLLHFSDLLCNFSVLCLHEGKIVIAVIILAARTEVACLHASKTVVCNWAIHRLDLCVHANTRVVDFAVCGRLAHASAETVAELHLSGKKFKFEL